MLSTISWILIIIALAVVLAIVVRKFPALALLDVNNIPGEKEARFKDKIIRQKVERDISRFSGTLARAYLFLSKNFSKILKTTQDRLQKIKLNYKSAARISHSEKEHLISRLFVDYEELVDKDDLEGAENKLLEIISLDQKNLAAFFELAAVYAENRKWPEAKQTYEYCLKLARQEKNREEKEVAVSIQEIYFSLAEACKEIGDLDMALDNIQEALEYEPNSPRYLDLILDLSIMKKDKELALASLAKLAEANPENQKLGDWQNKIDELS